eukprot:m.519998 g.519998  ORF g.519998 m.519998 type:complete len:119 (-) comp57492_c1_seq1:1133-1489(-)
MAQRAANSRDLLLSVFRGFGQGWLFDRAQALGITCVHDLRTTHPETLGSVVTPQFARESQDSATRLLQSLLQNESDPTFVVPNFFAVGWYLLGVLVSFPAAGSINSSCSLDAMISPFT